MMRPHLRDWSPGSPSSPAPVAVSRSPTPARGLTPRNRSCIRQGAHPPLWLARTSGPRHPPPAAAPNRQFCAAQLRRTPTKAPSAESALWVLELGCSASLSVIGTEIGLGAHPRRSARVLGQWRSSAEAFVSGRSVLHLAGRDPAVRIRRPAVLEAVSPGVPNGCWLDRASQSREYGL